MPNAWSWRDIRGDRIARDSNVGQLRNVRLVSGLPAQTSRALRARRFRESSGTRPRVPHNHHQEGPMSPDQIVRAWKDADYGACLPAASVPVHPVGPIDIADSALDVAGASAYATEYVETL